MGDQGDPGRHGEQKLIGKEEQITWNLPLIKIIPLISVVLFYASLKLEPHEMSPAQ